MASSRCGPPASLVIAPSSATGKAVGGLATPRLGVQLRPAHGPVRQLPLGARAFPRHSALKSATSSNIARYEAAVTTASGLRALNSAAAGTTRRRVLLRAAPGSGPGVLSRTDAPSSAPASASSSTSPSASASAAAATPPPAPPAPPSTPTLGGYLSLAFVPILWGTYNPSIRYLYAESDPLDPASLTAVRTIVSAGALLLPAAVGYLWTQGAAAWARRDADSASSSSSSGSGSNGVEAAAGTSSTRSSSISSNGASSSSSNGSSSSSNGVDIHHAPMSTAMAVVADGAADGVAAAAGSTPAEDDPALHTSTSSPTALTAASATAAAADSGSSTSNASSSSSTQGLFAEPLHTARLGPVLTRTFNSVVLGGLELGLLNFLGTALQVEGLHSTSATRAGFLAEVTAVLVPAVSYLAGYEIPRQMWVAVGIGLVGSTMVAYDASLQAKTDGGSSSSSSGSGSSGSSTGSAVVEPGAAAVVAAPPPVQLPAAVPSVAVDAAAAAASSSSSSSGITATTTTAATAAVADVMPDPMAAAVTPSLEAAADAANAAVAAITSTAAVVNTAGSALPLADPAILADTAAAAAAAAAVTVTVGAAADAAAAASDATAAAAANAAVAVTEVLASASAVAADAAASASSVAGAAAATVAATAAATAVATAGTTPGATALEATGGEVYLLLACLFYSVCTVRMGIYSPRHDTVSLAAMKKVGLSSMSLMWMAATNLQHGAALGSVFSFPDLSSRSATSLAVLAYSGLGPGALATLLQVQGLSTVPATTAQVIYSFTPLATAFFAFWILGGEPTGPLAWAGGMLLIGAALMAASVQNAAHKQKLREHEEATAAAAAAAAQAEAAGAGPTAAAVPVEGGAKQAVQASRK